MADFFLCSDWFVLRSSSLFIVGALEQMFGAIQQMEVADFLVFFLCFLGAPPLAFSLCETVTFEPLSGPGRARGFLGPFGASWQIFPCSE